MKKLAWIIVIALLLVIAFFQFKRYRRFHPGTDYNYSVSADIDVNYHDPRVVMDYYETAYKAGNFARSTWASDGIDVKFPDSGDPEEEAAARTYEQILATAKFLEEKLKNSKALKAQGFSNSDIREIEEKGLSPEKLEFSRQIGETTLTKGDEGPAVFLLQKLLIDQGMELPVDGKFIDQTESAVQAFQAKQGLIPTGIADPYTLEKLMKASPNSE